MTMKSVDLPHLRSVVLAGHAGAGKTTLAEQLLFRAGAIPRLGRVDDGTAHLDFEPIPLSNRSLWQFAKFRHVHLTSSRRPASSRRTQARGCRSTQIPHRLRNQPTSLEEPLRTFRGTRNLSPKVGDQALISPDSHPMDPLHAIVDGLLSGELGKSPAAGVVVGVMLFLMKDWWDGRTAKNRLRNALHIETRMTWGVISNLHQTFPTKAQVDAVVEAVRKRSLTFEARPDERTFAMGVHRRR